MKKGIFILMLVLATQSFSKNLSYINKYDAYFKYFGNKYNISYVLLKTVALTENDKLNPHAVRYNKNGTKDIGLMQINTIWIKEFKKMNLTEKKLLDPRVSIEVSAKILSNLINKKGYSWDTIGMYHSKTPKFKRKWVKRAKEKIRLIVKADKNVRLKK